MTSAPMESPPTPTKTPQKSTSSFDSAPLQALLQQNPSKLNESQLREYVSQLRNLRTSQPNFLKKLRDEVAEEPEMSTPKKVKAKAKEENLNKLLDEYN